LLAGIEHAVAASLGDTGVNVRVADEPRFAVAAQSSADVQQNSGLFLVIEHATSAAAASDPIAMK
jgi:hypothetical protein